MHAAFEPVLANLDTMSAAANERAGTSDLFEAERQIVDALRQPPELRFGDRKAATADFRSEKMPERTQSFLDTRLQPFLKMLHTLREHIF
jgi:hypothetical protein